MKSVLIATRPKWVEKICHKIGEDEAGKAIYEKRIEVRKTAPQEVPFKAYIYCTIGNGVKGDYLVPSGIQCGKVIGEFVCDKASELDYVYYWNNGYEFETCLTYRQVADYGKGKPLYGWHISDLKIYDRPRALSEFGKVGFGHKVPLCHPPQSWQYVEEL